MGSPIQRKAGGLTYPKTNTVSLLIARDVWPLCLVAKDSFWVMANEMPLSATTTFESVDEDELHVDQTLFEDHAEGEDIVANPQLILRMRVKRAEVRDSTSVSSLRLRVMLG